VAAFIYEPLVQGASGMRMYSAQLLSKLLKVARSKHILCIADEVFTGFGRTGRLFASEYLNYQPDLMALSKGLTGGTMALGITCCTSEIYEAFNSNELTKTFFHGHSFTGNPIACASANASFDLLMTSECKTSIERISNAQKTFADKIRNHSMTGNVRSTGTILAIDIKTDTKTSYTNNLKHHIYRYFMSKGVLLRPLGNVIYFLPSYVFTQEELALVHQHITNFLDELERG
jgi:adenosylmethionine-8-amino-7-oxononanoate aminotransferase